jgi:hypothetical protein
MRQVQMPSSDHAIASIIARPADDENPFSLGDGVEPIERLADGKAG